MAYPYSLWSSTPHDGFPPSPQPLSAVPSLVLDNAGYPSYPFEDPDKTYSPAEFASKFPAQPPQQTQGERTTGTDCEIANAPSTSPQPSEEYSVVGTSSYPAAQENIHPDAPTMTSTSQQLGGVQDTQRLMLRFPRSVVALADGARLQDIQVDTSDLDPLSTHERYNILGDITSDFGEASASGSNHSNMTSTADTSPIRRQAPVSTFDQPETMPKLLTSIDSVNVEAGSTNQSPDSTADVPTNVPNQATGPGVAVAGPVNGTATPSNPATTSTDIETRIIKAALKCSHLVGAYENLAADESTKRRSPMYLDQPPPYLSGEEQDTYRTQYDGVFPRLAFRWRVQLADVLL